MAHFRLAQHLAKQPRGLGAGRSISCWVAHRAYRVGSHRLMSGYSSTALGLLESFHNNSQTSPGQTLLAKTTVAARCSVRSTCTPAVPCCDTRSHAEILTLSCFFLISAVPNADHGFYLDLAPLGSLSGKHTFLLHGVDPPNGMPFVIGAEKCLCSGVECKC